MQYTITVTKQAQKDLQKVHPKDQKRIVASIEALRNNPFVGKKLRGEYSNHRSLRIGPYRAIYNTEHSVIKITVIKIGHRKDVYQ